MGNTTTRNINFEDIQFAINEQNKQSNAYIIINTLEAYQQHCLIAGTLTIEMEVDVSQSPLTFLLQPIRWLFLSRRIS